MARANLNHAAPNLPYIGGGRNPTEMPEHIAPPTKEQLEDRRVQQMGRAQRERARKERTSYRTKNKTKEYHIHVNRGGATASTEQARNKGIGDMHSVSAGGLRDICERGRKVLREAANDIAYAEELVRGALREVPPGPGEGRSAQWQRANRVARNLKRAANATQAGSAHMARTWLSYTREFERELAEFGGPRQKPRQVMDFRI